jgi:hypothetical protein
VYYFFKKPKRNSMRIEHTETRGSPSEGSKRAAKGREQVFKPPEVDKKMLGTTETARTKDQDSGLGCHTDFEKKGDGRG